MSGSYINTSFHFPRVMPMSGIARSHCKCLFNFIRDAKLFSRAAVLVYIPISSVQEFQLFCIFVNTWYLFIFKIILLVYLLLAVLCLLCRLPLVAMRGGYFFLWRVSFSLQWLLSLQSMGPGARELDSCSSQALEHMLSGCGPRA